LFEILQNGFHTPLTTTLVEGLFHAGCLSPDTGCGPSQIMDGQMIDDLLPLLKYRSSRQFTRRLPATRRPRPIRLSLPAAIPLVFVGAIATVIIGCFFFSPRSSMASPILTSAASPAAVSSSSVLAKTQTKKSVTQRRPRTR
jgi:hypothetical protein